MGTATGIELQCPQCANNGGDTSHDNLKELEDNEGKVSWHCFACGFDVQSWEWDKKMPHMSASEPTHGQQQEAAPTLPANFKGVPTVEEINQWPVTELEGRGISREAAEFYGVRTLYRDGKQHAHAYPVTDKDGDITGYQIRRLPKTFVMTKGTAKDVLFGQSAVGYGGQMVVVTEGADDCLAAYDLFATKGKRYKVVGSLGTTGWKRAIEWLETFDKVMICFDQDTAGKEAAREMCETLTPGKGRIVSWKGAKDVNDLLKAQRASDFMEALSKSKPHEVGGIITGEAAWNIIKNYTKPDSIPYPEAWSEMNRKAEGLRKGEISLWTGGSSLGKTAYMRALKHHALSASNWTVADVELEERPEKTIRGLLQYAAGKALHECSEDERRAAFESTYGTGRIYTLDHRANRKGVDMLGKFRYLHAELGVDLIFLDHVTLGVREFGEGNEGVDEMMEEFLTFVEQTGVHLALISHLRKTPGGTKDWDKGAVPSMSDLKGSGSLFQIAFDIVALSRDMHHPNDYIRNISQLHLLKCREHGNTGAADKLYFNSETKQLEVPDKLFMPDGGEEQGSLELPPADTGPINNFE